MITELKGAVAQRSGLLREGRMPGGTILIGRRAFSMCLHPSAIVCSKQDSRAEIGPPRKRGILSCFRERTLTTSACHTAFSGGVALEGPEFVWN